MAEGFTDEKLQELVDNYKKKQLVRSLSSMEKDRAERVFVNRSVSMDRIKYIGFDMDHTLVVYNSPEFEQLSFDMSVERLVSIGYPPEIREIDYVPSFPLRGLFFDKVYGNLLKADQFGNILSCFHGFQSLSSIEIRKFYPNKYVQPMDDRIYILVTLFHLPEIFLLAALVDFFDNHPSYVRIGEGPDWCQGVKCGDVLVTYKMIWQDVRTSVDWIHNQGDLKKRTLENLDKYIKKNPRLPIFLHKLRQGGRKTFVVTNSDYSYTQRLMTYMFDFPTGPEPGSPHREWKSYFDYIIVDAKKPLFFTEGSMLREVDEESCSLKLGVFTGALVPGKVYNGGSSDAFCKYTGAMGKEILYVGDHIFGDVIKAKKEQAWRTFLVLPELTHEVGVWESSQGMFMRLQNLEYILTELYRKTGEAPAQDLANLPGIQSLRRAIKLTAEEMEQAYPSQLGSLLRSGSRLTHFAIQATRFADLYSSCCDNLVNYPLNFLFSAPHQLMAHETPPSEVLPLSPGPSFPPRIHSRVKGPITRGMSIVDHDVDEEDSPKLRGATNKK